MHDHPLRLGIIRELPGNRRGMVRTGKDRSAPLLLFADIATATRAAEVLTWRTGYVHFYTSV